MMNPDKIRYTNCDADELMSPKKLKTRFKLFLGSRISTADELMNEWLNENPDVEVIDFKYQQDRYGDHSICIMYEVED